MKKGKRNNNPDNILVRLKDKLSLAMGIDVSRLKVMIDKHVMRTFNGKASAKTHFDRVNTYTELTATRMTIKVLFKFLAILDPKSVRITLTVTTRKDHTFTVHEDINFLTPIDIEIVEEETTKEEKKEVNK